MVGLLIKPSSVLQAFVKSIPDSVDIPASLNKLKNSDSNAMVSNADVRWIGNYIRKVLFISPMFANQFFTTNI